jgi:hypothetical protein
MKRRSCALRYDGIFASREKSCILPAVVIHSQEIDGAAAPRAGECASARRPAHVQPCYQIGDCRGMVSIERLGPGLVRGWPLAIIRSPLRAVPFETPRQSFF